jgi:hypothetical protein
MQTLRDNTSPIIVNTRVEYRMLRAEDYIDDDNKLTIKGYQALEDLDKFFRKLKAKEQKKSLGADGNEQMDKYRFEFPKGNGATGHPWRWSQKELGPRFIWFFNEYPEFDWDTVHAATKAYVDFYQNRNYEFMRNSGYFIYKDDKSSVRISDLAKWCEMYVDNALPEVDIDQVTSFTKTV